jgi:hypothetical protein
MSTTVRLICEVEVTVDTWDSGSTFDSLAAQAVREGKQILGNMRHKGVPVSLLNVKEVKFVTHSRKWEKD